MVVSGKYAAGWESSRNFTESCHLDWISGCHFWLRQLLPCTSHIWRKNSQRWIRYMLFQNYRTFLFFLKMPSVSFFYCLMKKLTEFYEGLRSHHNLSFKKLFENRSVTSRVLFVDRAYTHTHTNKQTNKQTAQLKPLQTHLLRNAAITKTTHAGTLTWTQEALGI